MSCPLPPLPECPQCRNFISPTFRPGFGYCHHCGYFGYITCPYIVVASGQSDSVYRELPSTTHREESPKNIIPDLRTVYKVDLSAVPKIPQPNFVDKLRFKLRVWAST